MELLRQSTRGRVPALVDLKNQRMAISPFTFFRGAVPVMAPDLAQMAQTGIVNQICGDAHVLNLGAYAGLDGRLVFDINDFDETIRAPFEWDVKRLATSLVLAARELHAKDTLVEEATLAFLSRYRKAMRLFATMPVTELARYQIRRLNEVEPISEILAKAQRSTPMVSLEKLTQPRTEVAKERKGASFKKARRRVLARSMTRGVNNTHASREERAARQFRSEPPELTRVTGTTAQEVLDSLGPYVKTLEPQERHFLAQYRPIDVAFKVVGTGSVGLRDYCVYLEGNGPEDPIFLQIKEEANSAYAAYLPEGSSSSTHQGHRVMDGARTMQLESDPFLGYTTIAGRDYLVRQLNDHKAALDLEDGGKELRSEGLVAYADLCGELLARGHARSGDPVTLAAYVGSSPRFDHAIASFAAAYADQTDRDWKQFTRALRGTQTSRLRR